jgi:hypothetical protein
MQENNFHLYILRNLNKISEKEYSLLIELNSKITNLSVRDISINIIY